MEIFKTFISIAFRSQNCLIGTSGTPAIWNPRPIFHAACCNRKMVSNFPRMRYYFPVFYRNQPGPRCWTSALVAAWLPWEPCCARTRCKAQWDWTVPEAMVAAATENGRTLGQDHRFQALHLDVREIRQTGAIAPESFDLIALNPPYRIPGSGRESEEELIRRARFRDNSRPGRFSRRRGICRTGTKGSSAWLHLAERLCDILETLRTRRLEPKRILAVHGKQGGQGQTRAGGSQEKRPPGLEP